MAHNSASHTARHRGAGTQRMLTLRECQDHYPQAFPVLIVEVRAEKTKCLGMG